MPVDHSGRPAPEPIAVLGRSVILPQGVDSPEALMEIVREKRQVTAHCKDVHYPMLHNVDWAGDGGCLKVGPQRGNYFSWEDILTVDRKYLKLTDKEARSASSYTTQTLEAALKALEDAGIPVEKVHRTRTGIFVGTYMDTPISPEGPDEVTVRNALQSGVADRVMFYLGTHGPSVTIDTACSSSMVALATGVASLRKGECDMAIVGACNGRPRRDYMLVMQAAGALSPEGVSKPFDEGANGMGRAEGAGAMVLKRLSDAERDGDNILAVIANTATGSAGAADDVKAGNGSGRVYEQPCAYGMSELIKFCLEEAKIHPSHVRFVEAHATGTSVGDIIELDGLARVFASHHHSELNPLLVASIKGNIGHAELAAGHFSVVKAIEMLRHRTFLPTGGLTTPRKDFDWEGSNIKPALEMSPFPSDGQPVYIGVSSFGIGGSYGHAILMPYVPLARLPLRLPPASPSCTSSHYLLPLSAITQEHLERFEGLLADHLEQHPEVSLADVCGTLALRRTRHPVRRMYVCSSREDLISQLRAAEKPAIPAAASRNDKTGGVAMVFTGQGAQWLGCGDALMCFPVYRRCVEAIDDLFSQLSGWSLRERMKTATPEELAKTELAAPLTFMVQAALFELLLFFRIAPSVVLGHSAGEVASFYAAGWLSLEQAVRLVYHRSVLQQKLAGCGRMLAVSSTAAEMVEVIQQTGVQDVEIACVNGPDSLVLAGPAESLEVVKQAIPTGIFRALVPGDIAFHSSLTEPILPEMAQQLSTFLDGASAVRFQVYAAAQSSSDRSVLTRRHAPVPLISSVTGEVFEGPMTADYWCRNVREPVQFLKASKALLSAQPLPSVILEVGPHPTLAASLMQTARSMGEAPGAVPVMTLLRRKTNDAVEFLGALGRLLNQGVEVSLDQWFQAEGYRLANLPHHPQIRKGMRAEGLNKVAMLREINLLIGHSAGPCAGQLVRVHGNVLARAEISENSLPKMVEHQIAQRAILPGMFYVMCGVELTGGLPCTLADVQFLNTCEIPRKHEEKVLLSTWLEEEQASAARVRTFKVNSSLLSDAMDPEGFTLHCQGRIMSQRFLEEGSDKLDVDAFVPGSFGLRTRTRLADIGKEGLAELQASHPVKLAGNNTEAYQVINQDGTTGQFYGPSFRLIQSVHRSADRESILCLISFETESRQQAASVGQNGYWPQLLDAMMQGTHLNPRKSQTDIWFFSGFEAMHLIRPPPADGQVWVRVHMPDRLCHRCPDSDISAYDSEGRLLVVVKATGRVYGGSRGKVRLSEPQWQPWLAAPTRELLVQRFGGDVEGGSLPAMESTRRIVDCIKEIGLAKLSKAVDSSQVVVRVLEVAPGSRLPADFVKQSITKALCDLPEPLAGTDVIIEVYTGVEDADLLDSVSVPVPTNATSWLRARRIVLPLALLHLANFGFDVVVSALHDRWTPSSAKGLTQLLAQSLPGTLAFVRNVPEPSMEQAVQELKERVGGVIDGDIVVSMQELEEKQQEEEGKRKEPDERSPGAEERKEGSDDEVEHRPVKGGMEPSKIAPREAPLQRVMLAMRLTAGPQATAPSIQDKQERVLILADQADMAQEMSGYLEAEGWSSSVVLCGPGTDLDDETAKREEWVAALKPLLEGKDAVTSIAFLAGLSDDSPLGANAFYRLISLAAAVTDIVKDSSSIERRPLWVAMRNVVSEPICIGQASLYSTVRQMENEIIGLDVRSVEMSSVLCLPQMAKLMASRPTECLYRLRLESPQPLVQRYRPYEPTEIVQTQVSADDLDSGYMCDLWTGFNKYAPTGQICTRFVNVPLKAPEDDEVTIEVHGAALNFRDVLLAMGLLPMQSVYVSAVGYKIGMEASGVVTAVGKNVKHLKVNDRVGFGQPGCFASRLNCDARLAYKLPDNISLDVGASSQSVYTTAHHALVELARVRKGDRVLIHAGAGGVGMAAISICQHLGAEVYATASRPKREVVAARGVDPARIFDSRSTSWFDDLMAATDGRGVRVVLNCLAGEHQRLGLEALSHGGHFLEIGKMDIYRNGTIGQLTMSKNASFSAIDMDRMALEDPEAVARLTATVFTHLSRGDYQPVPVTRFPMDRMKEAMELMKSAKHTGKILIVNRHDDGRPVQVTANRDLQSFFSPGVYLVTGGAGGFGSRLVYGMVHYGADHVVVTVSKDVSRIDPIFASLRKKSPHAIIEAVEADLSKEEDVQKVVDHLRATGKPLRGIFHSAGNTKDVTVQTVQRGDLEELGGPKNMGGWWLHEKTLDMKPDVFAVISSSSADTTGRGMTVYAATNAMLNSLVRYRRSLGLPACSLSMCTLSDVGVVVNNPAVREMQVKAGYEMVPSDKAFEDLFEVIVSGRPVVGHLQFEHGCTSHGRNAAAFYGGVRTPFVLGAAKGMKRYDTYEEILQFVMEQVKQVTHIDDVSADEMLANLCSDSLSVMEVTSRIKDGLGIEVPSSKVKMTATSADISRMLYELKQAAEERSGGAGDAPTEQGDEAKTDETAAQDLFSGQGGGVDAAAVLVLEAPSDDVPVRSAFEDEMQEEDVGTAEDDTLSASNSSSSTRCLPWPTRLFRKKRDPSADIVKPPQPITGTEDQPLTVFEARKWFKIYHKASNATRRLIVIPPAGSSAATFQYWVIPGVQVVAVEVPGREGRADEPFIVDSEVLGSRIAEAISVAGMLDGKPIAVAGHSNGSVLALQTCRTLKNTYNYPPEHFFPMACPAPHLVAGDFFGGSAVTAILFRKSMVPFMLWIAGGIPTPFRLDAPTKRLRDLVWPEIVGLKRFGEKHNTVPLPAEDMLDCPITTLVGSLDIIVNPKTNRYFWRSWDDYTTNKVRLQYFRGHHFFCFQPENVPDVLQTIHEALVTKQPQQELAQ